MSSLKDYDFIVGFTLFTPKGFKTMYRHFDKLETAKLFASNKNIKNNCKIYVDLEFHEDEMKKSNKLYEKQIYKEKEKNKELENKIKGVLELIDTKPYTAYTLYGDILYDDENIKEIIEGRN